MTRITPERLAEIRAIVEHAPWCELACAAAEAVAEIDALRAERDAFHGRMTVLEIERNAAEMARESLRADRDRLRRDLDAKAHGPAGRLYTSDD